MLGEKVTIRNLLESEGNREEEYDKYNRVDMLAKDSRGSLMLIEIQNDNEYAYFQRMLFGVSKLVTEYIRRGEGYGADEIAELTGLSLARRNPCGDEAGGRNGKDGETGR